MKFETVIGLEVHVELSTATKIFCGCTTKFGGEPNTQVCPVCTGMPGSLPVFNREVADYAIRAGLALGCSITPLNKFDRKNYFYPDLPKAYQLSQLYLPICRDGGVDIEVGGEQKRVRIREIHMEEDAGKLIHHPQSQRTFIDYNRGGVPLIEIVSEPDMRTADEVTAYLELLRETLLYLGVSDCKMQEGSLRADINLSIRPVGSREFGTRTEMKNLNSFKAIQRATLYEARRQIDIIEDGGKVEQETRRWDDEIGESFAMRSKENAHDYRYFPEPDLLPLEIGPEWIDRVKSTMPETPALKRERYTADLGLAPKDAALLTTAKPISDLFESTAKLSGNPKESANLILGGVMRLMRETSTTPEELALPAEKLAALVGAVSGGVINRDTGKEVLEQLFRHGKDPLEYIEENSLAMTQDTSLILAAVEKAIAENPNSVLDYRAGKEKALGFLVGKAMKELRGKGNPHTVNALLREKLSG